MEMTVIIVILLLIAAAIVPNVVSVLNSEQLKSTEATIARLPAMARADAVKNQNPVQLRFDGSSVVEEEVEANGNTDLLNTIDLGDSVQVDQSQKNYLNVDPSSWDWTAYPDGTSDTGGVEVLIDSEKRSLIISSSGDALWTTGPLPDESQDQWTAGQLQQRAT
jgi:hypothetical protein